LLKKELKLLGQLPVDQFERNAEMVEADLRLARERNIGADDPAIRLLKSNSTRWVNSTTPRAWMALSQIVNYKEPNIDSWQPCFSATNQIGPVHFSMEWIIGPGIVAQNCLLDVEQYRVSGGIFQNCLILYSGGPVLLKDAKFQNCTFIFRIKRQPPASGRAFAKAVLGGGASFSVTT
jgi:hypothetical protein